MNFSFINQKAIQSSGHSIAIVGAGVSGLSSAGYLSSAGHAVTVFDRLTVAGGLMSYGIPEWRIPQANIQIGVDRLQEEFGVQFEFNTKIVGEESESDTIGDIVVQHKRTLEEIRKEYSAVLIATGAWGERSLGIEGEEKTGVYSGIDFLYRVRAKHYDNDVNYIDVKDKRVVVIGAGFTAIDVAIRAVQLEARSVLLVYRRTSKEAPAGQYEINHAIKGGAEWIEQHTPKRILGNSSVEGIRFHNTKEGEDIDIPCDIVLKAVGDTSIYPITVLSETIAKTKDTKLMEKERLYMAGDAYTGASKIGKASCNGIAISRMLIGHLEEGKKSWYFSKGDIALRG